MDSGGARPELVADRASGFGSERGSRVAFWELAREVVAEARRQGLSAPGFRSPPRLRGATRTLRRYPDGHCLVSVQGRGRAPADVLADMVEGLMKANGLEGPAAESCRTRIMEALAASVRSAA